MKKTANLGNRKNELIKVVFFESKELDKSCVQARLTGCKCTFIDAELQVSNAHLAKDADIICTFIYSRMGKDVLTKLRNVKMIATMSTGYDHIDIKACKKRNISICNVPSYGENTVAEHTFALILSISRKINQSLARTKMGDFSLDGLQGFDLKGKTLGVIGTGRIGMHVIRIAKGFEMDVIAYDMYPNAKLSLNFGFKYVELRTLFSSADIITLHVPYSKETRHIINRKNLSLTKKGAIIINTSRGGNVDTKALTAGLLSGRIAGAGLDVLEEESNIRNEDMLLRQKFSDKDMKILLENHLLLKMDNVIITPHNAFNSKEALQRIVDVSVENIVQFISHTPTNLVSK